MSDEKYSNKRLAIFLGTSGQSGVDRAALNLIPELARRGYQIDVLKVREHGPNLPTVPDRVRVIDLGQSHVYPCVFAVWKYLREFRPVYLLSDKDRVNRTARLAHRWSGVHETRHALWVGTPISLEMAHRPERKQRRFMNRARSFYPKFECLMADSPGVRDDYIDNVGVAPDRIKVVPRPVIPNSLFSDKPARPDHPWLEADAQEPIVVAVGELSDGKDYPTLLRAFAHLNQAQPARLLIIGKGKRLQVLRELAASLGIADRVDFLGFRTDVYAFIAHADLLAHSSVREGLSFVLLEALACGTPVVATDCPTGPRAVLQHGKYGPLVPVGNAQALGEAMHSTLRKPLAATVLQEAARPYEIQAAAAALLRTLQLPDSARPA